MSARSRKAESTASVKLDVQSTCMCKALHLQVGLMCWRAVEARRQAMAGSLLVRMVKQAMFNRGAAKSAKHVLHYVALQCDPSP